MAESTHTNVQDLEEDRISHETVETWGVEELKEYCRRRGYKCSGSKKELVARVYVLYNSNIQEIAGVREEEVSRKRDYRALLNKGKPSTDPHLLKKWIGELEGLKLWPPVSYLDIHWFLQQNGEVGMSREGLTAYKTGKAYSYFKCDWLKEVYYSPINKSHTCCYLKADCLPSNRLGNPPHNVWVKIEKTSGEIVAGYCSCVAGLSQTCNHVSALLFKVNHAHKLELSNPACTSKANEWKTPSGAKTEVNLRLRDMTFLKPSYGKEKDSAVRGLGEIKSLCKIRETLVNPDDSQCYKHMIDSLRESMPNALLFLPGDRKQAAKNNTHNETCSSTNTDQDVVIMETPINEPPPKDVPDCADIPSVARNCMTVDQLISKITLTDADRNLIQEKTIGQSENPLWFQLRKGRVTASRFYNVFTRIETMKRDSSQNCDKLVDNIIAPPSLSHISHVTKGSRLEQAAFTKLVDILEVVEGHRNVVNKPCGLFIDASDQYLGASPDGIVSCDCCDRSRLVEIKCPSTELESYPHINQDTKKLKKKDLYYGQVQGQMMVTGTRESWFFVFYENGNSHLELIEYDEEFCTKMRAHLGLFYKLYMAPKLLLGRKRK